MRNRLSQSVRSPGAELEHREARFSQLAEDEEPSLHRYDAAAAKGLSFEGLSFEGLSLECLSIGQVRLERGQERLELDEANALTRPAHGAKQTVQHAQGDLFRRAEECFKIHRGIAGRASHPVALKKPVRRRIETCARPGADALPTERWPAR